MVNTDSLIITYSLLELLLYEIVYMKIKFTGKGAEGTNATSLLYWCQFNKSNWLILILMMAAQQWGTCPFSGSLFRAHQSAHAQAPRQDNYLEHTDVASDCARAG